VEILDFRPNYKRKNYYEYKIRYMNSMAEHQIPSEEDEINQDIDKFTYYI